MRKEKKVRNRQGQGNDRGAPELEKGQERGRGRQAGSGGAET